MPDLGKTSTCQDVLDKFGIQKDSQKGKIAIITGGHSGIGLETVRTLTNCGIKVINGCRSIANAVASMKKAEIDMTNVTVLELNLENLASIKVFAEKCLLESRIDFLILNAGVSSGMVPSKVEFTQYGFEKIIGTNHFGHFYLTSLLLDKMKIQEFTSKIVCVASMAHKRSKLDLKDLHFKSRKFDRLEAYGQSKGANILFIKELADRLQGTKVFCFSLHPGIISTNIFYHLPSIVKCIIDTFFVNKTCDQGAATTITACFNTTLESDSNRGIYLEDCKTGTVTEYWSDNNKTLRKDLWDLTESQLAEALN